MGQFKLKFDGIFLLLAFYGCFQVGTSLLAWADGEPNPPLVTMQEVGQGFQTYNLPVGTPIAVTLLTPIDTTYNQMQDPIEATIMQPLYCDSAVMLSKHTRFRGEISILERPIQGRNAMLGVHFTEMLLENGERVPISAHIRTGTKNNAWGGGLTPGTKPMAVTHRVMDVGDYNQIVMGGPRAMGENLQFQPGEPWVIVLEQPISIVLPMK